MSFKVTIETKPPKAKYPWIGEYDGWVVLFVGKDKGTCLVSNVASSCAGEYSSGWTEEKYKPIGSLTITQDI